MTKAEYHLPAIPDGYQIYEERLEIAGLAHRKADASRFVRGKHKSLEWERDVSNSYDTNAIKLLGRYKYLFMSRCVFLGYVPRAVAKTIVERGLWGEVRPRLLKTYISGAGFVEILFQVLGPKARINKYRGLDLGQQRDHYTDAVELVKQLKREKRHDEAISLLQELIAETEADAEAAGEGRGVAPWYYEQMAILFRKERRYKDEIAILERYARQPKASGAGPQKLAERLKKARQLSAYKT